MTGEKALLVGDCHVQRKSMLCEFGRIDVRTYVYSPWQQHFIVRVKTIWDIFEK